MEITYKSGSPALLWKQALLPVYLFFGEEDRLKEEAVAALIAHVVSPDFADFDLETLDASDAAADSIHRWRTALPASIHPPHVEQRQRNLPDICPEACFGE